MGDARYTDMDAAFIHDRRAAVLLAVLGGLAAVGLATSIWLATKLAGRNGQIAAQAQALRARPIDPVAGTRSIVMKPSRNGALAGSMVSIGGERVELIEFKYDVGWSGYSNFRVTMDRVDQGRFAVLTNLARDSNGQLRLAFNSSALGPGDYEVQIEGIDWRGSPTPQGWARFTVTR
jgi:hypothetical protein